MRNRKGAEIAKLNKLLLNSTFFRCSKILINPSKFLTQDAREIRKSENWRHAIFYANTLTQNSGKANSHFDPPIEFALVYKFTLGCLCLARVAHSRERCVSRVDSKQKTSEIRFCSPGRRRHSRIDNS